MSNLQQSFPSSTLDARPSKPPNRSQPGRKKTRPPFSLRLTKNERAKLEHAAAGLPLGPFIKAKLLDGDLSPRRSRGAAPVKDHAALAQALGLLGNLRLANNLNQLAKAANMGARVRGEHSRIRKENEKEAWESHVRDREVTDSVVFEHLSERRALQQEHHAERKIMVSQREELTKDRARFESLRTVRNGVSRDGPQHER